MNFQETGRIVALSGSPFEDPIRLLGWMLIGLVVVAAIAIWMLFARSPFIQEDDMDQPSRVGQMYGYAVCLIVVVIGVITTSTIINKTVALASPGAALQSDYYQPSLTSFEAYLATRGRERPFDALRSETASKADTLSAVQLRARYEALRDDRLARERREALRTLISSAVLLALAVVLFVVHWRWLGQPLSGRRREATPTERAKTP